MANQAAWLPAKGAQLEVKESVLGKPGPHEVLIRNHAIAINPVDRKIQDYGVLVKTYPAILGLEVAGEVEEVGEGVTQFSKGDRVCGLAIALRSKNPAHAGFQLFTLAFSYALARIPATLPFANAVVLPLGLATAAAGLYEPQYLNLAPPGQEPPTHTSSTKPRAILIWGGSSVVGSCAIQLAVASGLRVVTTASAKNHAYVQELGATHVFDHGGPNVVAEIIAALDGSMFVGAYDAISEVDTTEKCADVLHHFGGGTLLATRAGDVSSEVLLGNVRRLVVYLSSPSAEESHIWVKVWGEFMERGLRDGSLKAKPDPVIIKGGLEKCQEALDVYRRGVSAAKVVVTL